MATQRLIVATIVGRAATVVADRFDAWFCLLDAADIDNFCASLRANGDSLTIAYFCEWTDRWSMGDTVPGPNAVAGRRFEASCTAPESALSYADRLGTQFAEAVWFAARLREAAVAGIPNVPRIVVVVREVLVATATDDEVAAATGSVPNWLFLPAEPPASARGSCFRADVLTPGLTPGVPTDPRSHGRL